MEGAAAAALLGVSTPPSGGDIPPNAFPRLVMKLLNEETAPDALWWLPDGKAFAIDPKTVPSKILDKYFRGTKFSSFIRRLHNAGFRRTTRIHKKDPAINLPEGGITLSHDMFQRDKPELVEDFSKQHVSHLRETKLSYKLQHAKLRASLKQSAEAEIDLTTKGINQSFSQAVNSLMPNPLLQQPSLQQALALDAIALPAPSAFALREQPDIMEPVSLQSLREASVRSLPDASAQRTSTGMSVQEALLQRQFQQESSMMAARQQMLMRQQQEQLQLMQLQMAAAAGQDRARKMDELLLLARLQHQGAKGPQDP